MKFRKPRMNVTGRLGKGAISTDPAEFLREANKQAKSGGKILVLKRQGMSPAGHVGELDLHAVAQSENFLLEIKQAFGEGNFILQIAKNDMDVIKEFAFTIGTPRATRSRRKDDEPGPHSPYNPSSGVAQVLAQQNASLIQALTGNKNEASQVLDALKVGMEMSTAGRQSMDEIFAVLLQGALQPGPDPIEQMQRMFEMSKQMQPQVEQADSIMGLLQTALGFLQQGAAAKGSGVSPQLMQTMQALSRQTQAGPPAPGQPARPVPASAVGGESAGFSPRTPPPASGVEVVRTPEAGAAPEQSLAHKAFYDMMIKPFRDAVEAGAPAEVLAQQVMSMAQTAAIWQASAPHPLVAPFVTAQTAFDLNSAFATFCASIPELRNRRSLQEEVKAVLRSALVAPHRDQGAEQESPSEDMGEVNADDQTDPSEPEHEPDREDSEPDPTSEPDEDVATTGE